MAIKPESSSEHHRTEYNRRKKSDEHGNIAGTIWQLCIIRPIDIIALLLYIFNHTLDHNRAGYSILLTFLTAVIAASMSGYAGVWLAILTFVTMVLQTALREYRYFNKRLIEVMWYTPGQADNSGRFFKLAPWLAVTPLLSVAHVLFGWLLLALVFAWFMPKLDRLASRWRNRKQITRQALIDLREYTPLVGVHVAGVDSSGYMINQWLPVLEKFDTPIVIIVREYNMLAQLDETTVPILYVHGRAYLEEVMEAGMLCMLYPGNAKKNTEAFRTFHVQHVFINHGESDKASNQNKMLMAYDKILVAGPLAERRMHRAGLALRKGQVEHVGRPQTELFLKRQETPKPIRTILYAPTWEGLQNNSDYSSIGAFSTEVLQDLFTSQQYKVMFKPHPTTGWRDGTRTREVERLQQLCIENGHEFLDPQSSIMEAMNRSDLLITDISSVLNDYLATKKPIILCVTRKLTKEELASEYPSSRAAYHLRQDDKAGILDLVQRIDTEDTMAEQRSEVRADSLGEFEQGSLERFRTMVQAFVDI